MPAPHCRNGSCRYVRADCPIEYCVLSKNLIRRQILNLEKSDNRETGPVFTSLYATKVKICSYKMKFISLKMFELVILQLLSSNNSYFPIFPACFSSQIFFFNLNYNCSNLLGMRNLQKQVEKSFYCQKLFKPFTVWINCSSSDLKQFSNPRPSASNFKSFSRSLEFFFFSE